MDFILALLLAFNLSIATGNHTGNNDKTTTTSAPASYVERFSPLADSLETTYGIPSGIILAVAIIESGHGTSRNSKLLNNHFGITGKNNLRSTHGIKSAYKQYATIEDSYADFCQLLARKKFYPTLKGNPDEQAWVMAISKAGYSTKPEAWRGKVKSALKKYNL